MIHDKPCISAADVQLFALKQTFAPRHAAWLNSPQVYKFPHTPFHADRLIRVMHEWGTTSTLDTKYAR
jgi:hypothetical protein